MFEGSLPLGHELPTNSSNPSYDGPEKCLGHLYGELKPPSKEYTPKNLLPLPQSDFISPDFGWAEFGLVYIPEDCDLGFLICKLHVILHDCGTREEPLLPPAGDMTSAEKEFARYAETNNIILMMPRLEAGGSDHKDIERGCWDVFGQFGKDYAHQSSPHLGPIMELI
jgi:hypothetical protein